jgi:hypothetical protein
MDRSDALKPAFRQLRSLGLTRVSAIGGRTIARALVDAALVQDLYLTTGDRTGGEPDTPLFSREINRRLAVKKRGTGPEAGIVFEHSTLSTP